MKKKTIYYNLYDTRIKYIKSPIFFNENERYSVCYFKLKAMQEFTQENKRLNIVRDIRIISFESEEPIPLAFRKQFK